jgi:hypothetical protein
MSQSVDLKAGAGPAPTLRASLLQGFTASLREHALLIGIIAVHFLIGAAMPTILGRPLHFTPSLFQVVGLLWLLGFWTLLIPLTVGFAVAAIRRGQARPLVAAFRWLREVALRRDRVWGCLIVFAVLPVFGWDFGFLQVLLPFLHPIDWDPTFAAWDQAVHFGRQPFEWLQLVLGFPVATSVLSFIYALWFFILYAVNFWQAFDRRDPVLRMQYLLCTTLLWALLGNFLGTILASGGPVYYGRLTGLPDPFVSLFQYLDTANGQFFNYSRDIQEKMWRFYLVNGQDGKVAGAISAMPSLHVASSCGFYLLARATNRWLGWLFLLFLWLMLLGSVHLGWHYAIDGYAGLAGAVAIWWGCGRLVRWPVMQRFLWGETTRPAGAPAGA